MSGLPGNHIVEIAVGLLRESPDRPAIEILDRAMQQHAAAPCADGALVAAPASAGAYLDPPSPFAELLRRAFAPGMDPRELALAGLHARQSDAPELQEAVAQASDRWQAVMELFAERYRLWEAGR